MPIPFRHDPRTDQLSGLNFLYADTMQVEHEFPLDYIFLCADAFGVLDYALPSFVVSIDKVGNVLAGLFDADADRFPFEVGAALAVLGRDKFIGHLLTEIGDKSCTLPQLELVSAVMFLFRGVFADTFCTVLVVLAR